jgi:acetylornithine/succinyldiaminopimelate/putrescine aminotransferase
MRFEEFPAQALMEITSRPPLVFVRGDGSWLWDHDGKRYLDFVQGWAVNCLITLRVGNARDSVHRMRSGAVQRSVVVVVVVREDRAG